MNEGRIPRTLNEAKAAQVHRSTRSIDEIAGHIGVAYSTVCDWANRNSDKNPPLSKLQSLFDATGRLDILRYFAWMNGLVLTPVPRVAPRPNCDLVRFFKSCADSVEKFQQATADQEWTADERSEFLGCAEPALVFLIEMIESAGEEQLRRSA